MATIQPIAPPNAPKIPGTPTEALLALGEALLIGGNKEAANQFIAWYKANKK